MSKILKVKNVSDYIGNLGDVNRHPLVGVVDFSEVSPIPHSLNSYGVYGVFMHKHLSVDLTYGCGKYDYKNGGTIICVAPGQIDGKEDNGERINRLSPGKSITDTAYYLGFDFPGHLSRLFKKKEGISPSEYIKRLRTKKTVNP